MKSLVLKIFVLCWITHLVVFTVFMLLVRNIDLPGSPDHGPGGRESQDIVIQSPGPLSGKPDRGPRDHENHVGIAGQAAISALSSGGPEALREYLDSLSTAMDSPIYILNDRDQDVLGRTVPDEAVTTARRMRDGRGPGGKPFDMNRWEGRLVQSPEGERYVAVGQRRSIPHHGPHGWIGPSIMPLLTIIVTAGFVALALAYSLTAPIKKLRATAQQFAAGELEARVGPLVATRRDAIGELGRDFDAMASRIESLITAQRRLLQDVSHELRSPLARLNLALGIAARKAGAEAQDALDRIEHEAEQLNELIGQLLTLSRLESTHENLERSKLDLLVIVNEVAADADFEAEARGCKVRVTKRDSCIVRGVETLLRSAIENVLRNAISYTARGTDVEVEISRQIESGQPHAVVTIRDHGPGVPQEHLESIFRPFHRVEDARDRNRGGTGLGLAIAARAAHIHGGSISADTAPEGGLIVKLRIPAVTCETDSVSEGTA